MNNFDTAALLVYTYLMATYKEMMTTWREKYGDEKAVALIRELAEKGDAEAQYTLGMCYDLHVSFKGVHENGFRWDFVEEGFGWHMKAAEQGHVDAMRHVGRAYNLGMLGVKKNQKLAVYWLEKAVEKGDLGAMASLVYHYINGIGCTEDQTKAREYLIKSVATEHPERYLSKVPVGWAYEYGQLGFPVDYAQAWAWYNDAVPTPEATENIKRMIKEGKAKGFVTNGEAFFRSGQHSENNTYISPARRREFALEEYKMALPYPPAAEAIERLKKMA